MKSIVKFPQSVIIAGVGPLCFIKSRVNTAVYQEILEHYMLPSAHKLNGYASYSSRTWAKTTSNWFAEHDITLLDWPANSPDLNPVENLWGIVKREMRDTRPNNTNDLKAAIKETWAFITPQQCHRLVASMPRCIDVVIRAKGAKYLTFFRTFQLLRRPIFLCFTFFILIFKLLIIITINYFEI